MTGVAQHGGWFGMVGALKQRPERALLRTQPGKMVQMHHKVGGVGCGAFKTERAGGL